MSQLPLRLITVLIEILRIREYTFVGKLLLSFLKFSLVIHFTSYHLEGRWDRWNFAVMLDYEIKATI